jgi:hypothetical protein
VADLERRIPTIVLSGSATGDRVFVDGRPATVGEPVAVDPGKHTVSITSPSGATRTLSVDAAEGSSTPVDVAAGAPAPQPAGASPATSGDDADGSLAPAIAAFSVGGAGLVAFGVTGALWLGEKSTVDEECPARRCSPEGLDAGDAGQTLGVVNAIALGVGVVGLAAGGVLLWASSADDPAHEENAAAASIRWSGTGVSVDGSF